MCIYELGKFLIKNNSVINKCLINWLFKTFVAKHRPIALHEILINA